MDPISRIEQAVSTTGRTVAGIQVAQLDRPTPCAEWDVRGLLNHVIGGCLMFGAVLSGSPYDASSAPADLVGDDPETAYTNATKLALEAWRTPGALEKTLDLGFGPMPGSMVAGLHFNELLVHGWDLAKATGQDSELPEALAAGALELARHTDPGMRGPGKFFGAEIVPPAGASTTQQLVALLGRQP